MNEKKTIASQGWSFTGMVSKAVSAVPRPVWTGLKYLGVAALVAGVVLTPLGVAAAVAGASTTVVGSAVAGTPVALAGLGLVAAGTGAAFAGNALEGNEATDPGTEANKKNRREGNNFVNSEMYGGARDRVAVDSDSYAFLGDR